MAEAEQGLTLVTQVINTTQKIYEPWDKFKQHMQDESVELSKSDETRIRFYIYFTIITSTISIYLLISSYGSIYLYKNFEDFIQPKFVTLLTILFIISYILNSIKIYGAYKCLESMKFCNPFCAFIASYFCVLYISPCVICNDMYYNKVYSNTRLLNRNSLINYANNEDYIGAITAICGIGDTINHLIGLFTKKNAVTALRIISLIWSIVMIFYGLKLINESHNKIGFKRIIFSPLYLCCPGFDHNQINTEKQPLLVDKNGVPIPTYKQQP